MAVEARRHTPPNDQTLIVMAKLVLSWAQLEEAVVTHVWSQRRAQRNVPLPYVTRVIAGSAPMPFIEELTQAKGQAFIEWYGFKEFDRPAFECLQLNSAVPEPLVVWRMKKWLSDYSVLRAVPKWQPRPSRFADSHVEISSLVVSLAPASLRTFRQVVLKC